MNVGYGGIVIDRLFPENHMTGLSDIEGNEIKCRDVIEIRGCRSKYVIVGLTCESWRKDPYMIYFSREDRTTIGWNINQELIVEYHAKIRNDVVIK